MDTGCVLTTVTLGTRDPFGLARFYARLLGWDEPSPERTEDDWIALRRPGGGVGLAFQREPTHVRPVWPQDGEHQQMQAHLEIRVDDLRAALSHARSCGAQVADFQPQADVRVCLDPAGHPFCLWVES